MPIETVKDTNLQMMVHTILGVPTAVEMHSALDLSSYDLLPRLLWDMTNAEISQVDVNALKEFLSQAISINAGFTGGKTAIVAPGDLLFGLARMSATLLSRGESGAEPRAFRDRESAIAWLTTDAMA